MQIKRSRYLQFTSFYLARDFQRSTIYINVHEIASVEETVKHDTETSRLQPAAIITLKSGVQHVVPSGNKEPVIKQINTVLGQTKKRYKSTTRSRSTKGSKT